MRPSPSISQLVRVVTRPSTVPSSGKGSENVLSETNDSVVRRPVGSL
jgi:hypothetical protein